MGSPRIMRIGSSILTSSAKRKCAPVRGQMNFSVSLSKNYPL